MLYSINLLLLLLLLFTTLLIVLLLCDAALFEQTIVIIRKHITVSEVGADDSGLRLGCRSLRHRTFLNNHQLILTVLPEKSGIRLHPVAFNDHVLAHNFLDTSLVLS